MLWSVVAAKVGDEDSGTTPTHTGLQETHKTQTSLRPCGSKHVYIHCVYDIIHYIYVQYVIRVSTPHNTLTPRMDLNTLAPRMNTVSPSALKTKRTW
jgi:hypothetical protein